MKIISLLCIALFTTPPSLSASKNHTDNKTYLSSVFSAVKNPVPLLFLVTQAVHCYLKPNRTIDDIICVAGTASLAFLLHAKNQACNRKVERLQRTCSVQDSNIKHLSDSLTKALQKLADSQARCSVLETRCCELMGYSLSVAAERNKLRVAIERNRAKTPLQQYATDSSDDEASNSEPENTNNRTVLRPLQDRPS